MAECLQNDEVLAVFPEGTTGDGTTVLPFHANLFQAAIAANAPVMPIGLKFVDAVSKEPSFAPCYVGDDTLIGSVWRTLCADPIEAVIQFGQSQRDQGRDRRAWAAEVREAVVALRV
jgi:1-acyl-sn-glycerol-3-phosphate acyltransferase